MTITFLTPQPSTLWVHQLPQEALEKEIILHLSVTYEAQCKTRYYQRLAASKITKIWMRRRSMTWSVMILKKTLMLGRRTKERTRDPYISHKVTSITCSKHKETDCSLKIYSLHPRSTCQTQQSTRITIRIYFTKKCTGTGFRKFKVPKIAIISSFWVRIQNLNSKTNLWHSQLSL